MGAGLDMEEGDIAFKCNFATYDAATGIVVRRRADRKFEEEGPLLCKQLDGERHTLAACALLCQARHFAFYCVLSNCLRCNGI